MSYDMFEDFKKIISEFQSIKKCECYVLEFSRKKSYLIKMSAQEDDYVAENVMKKLIGLNTDLVPRLYDLAHKRYLNMKVDFYLIPTN